MLRTWRKRSARRAICLTGGRRPAAEEIADNAGKGSSLLERLRREVYEESDDELDILEKEANLVHDVFSRPPTGTHEGTSPSQPYIHGTQHSGIDAAAWRPPYSHSGW
jgi:hypothetical protein